MYVVYECMEMVRRRYWINLPLNDVKMYVFTCNGKHGQAAVLQLSELHLLPGLQVTGLEAEWVEAKVSRGSTILHLVELAKSLGSEDEADDLNGSQGALGNNLLKGLEGLVAYTINQFPISKNKWLLCNKNIKFRAIYYNNNQYK